MFGTKEEQLKKLQDLCDFLINYLQARGAISSYESQQLRVVRSASRKLDRLFEHITSDAKPELLDEIRQMVLSEPSCAWFASHLDSSSFEQPANKKDETEESLCRLGRRLSVRDPEVPAAGAVKRPSREQPVGRSASAGALLQRSNTPRSSASSVKATAIREYRASENDELSFIVGDVIDIFKQTDPCWWWGQVNGKTGTFPSSHVKISGSLAETGDKCSTLVTVNQLACLPDGAHVCGVTHLGDRVYVVRSKHNSIEVYKADGFEFVRHVTIVELQTPSDMTASPLHSRLVVLDSLSSSAANSAVTLVDPVKGTLAARWNVDDAAECLSVSSVGTVIAASYLTGKLREFNVDGKLLRTVKLHEDLAFSWHAVLLPTGEFVVSHGNTGHNGDHRVCKLYATDNSPPMLSYGDGPDADKKLKVPFQLAVHSRGFVLVTDTFNCRVAVLDSSLRFVRFIYFSTDDDDEEDRAEGERGNVDMMLCPSNVCLDETRRRLYVSFNTFKDGAADADNINKVKVYRLVVNDS